MPPTVRERLGELTAAGLLLASSLKFDGSLLLQIQGTGPARLFVAECQADGRFRATVKLQDGTAIPHDASFGDLVNPDGNGRFAVTLLPASNSSDASKGLDNPYQGIIPFEGDTVSAHSSGWFLKLHRWHFPTGTPDGRNPKISPTPHL